MISFTHAARFAVRTERPYINVPESGARQLGGLLGSRTCLFENRLHSPNFGVREDRTAPRGPPNRGHLVAWILSAQAPETMPSNRARESGSRTLAVLLTLAGMATFSLMACDDSEPALGNDGGPFAGIDAGIDAAPMSNAKVDGAAGGAGGKGGAGGAGKKDAGADAAQDAPGNGSGGSSAGSGGTTSSGGSGSGSGSGGGGGYGGAGPLTCEQCQRKYCMDSTTDYDYVTPCFDPKDSNGMPARATAGPMMGALKSDLCKAVLNCVQNNPDKCYNWPFDQRGTPDSSSCYCGKMTSDLACQGTAANGPCKAAFEAAAEISSQATAGADVAANIADVSFALGAAIQILDGFCDQTYCAGSCLGLPAGNMPPNQGGGGAPLQSGGTGGAAGRSGAGGKGGNGGAVGGGGAGGKGGGGGARELTFVQCRACESTACPFDLSACEQATGNATAGPKAGTPKKDLCTALVACMRRSQCVKPEDGDQASCYCGATDETTCITAGGTGPCKAEWEAAAESTSAAVITGEHYTDTMWASGLAFNLVGCDSFNCEKTAENPQNPSGHCFDGDPVAAGGGGGAGGGRGGAGGGGRGGTTGNGGITAGGGTTVASGGVTGSGGVSSSGGTTGVLANGRFDVDAGSWTTEYGMQSAWSSAHDAGGGAASSGALAVTNPVVFDQEGSTMGGARQCLSIGSGSSRVLAAQAFIVGGQNGLGAGQIGGSAGMGVSFYPTADCSGTSNGSFIAPSTTVTNAWTPLGLSVAVPTGSQSMALRLVVTKTFRDGAFQVFFDNVTAN